MFETSVVLHAQCAKLTMNDSSIEPTTVDPIDIPKGSD